MKKNNLFVMDEMKIENTTGLRKRLISAQPKQRLSKNNAALVQGLFGSYFGPIPLPIFAVCIHWYIPGLDFLKPNVRDFDTANSRRECQYIHSIS